MDNNLRTKKSFYRFPLSVLIFALANCSLSTASMTVDRMILYFNPKQLPRQDVTVTNPDDETLYLETEIFHVLNPGTPEEKLEKISNPDEMKLLATPQKAVIPANTHKSIRLINLESPKEKEQVYRVTFRPVVGDLQATRSAVKILIAYQALVFVRPEKPFYEIIPSQKSDTLLFANSGNMNVVLRNTFYCSTSKDKTCKELKKSGRIYPGQNWQMELPQEATENGGIIKYGLFDGDNEVSREFTLSNEPNKNQLIRSNGDSHNITVSINRNPG